MFGKPAWNIGLDKESDARVKAISEKRIGTKASEETKAKQRQKRAEHPLKARHTTPHSKETKEFLRENTARLWAEGVFNRVTSIHLKTREFLQSIKLSYEFKEELQVKYFALDFAFPDIKIGIECQGTYYHVDPRIYPNGPKDKIQRRNFGRDKAKRNYLAKLGWRIIEVWETEINDGSFKEYLLCKFKKIRNIKAIGRQNTLDFEVNHPDHNFYAEGIVVSNSHSVATSYLSAMTVYLKYKYPLKFFKACLNTVKHLPSPMDEISAIEKELPYFGLKLLPPHLLKSDMEFKEEDGNLRFGLAYLKGIADKALEKLINFRKPHANKFEIFLSAKESGINISVLSSLICSGCLDENEQTNRPRLLAEAHLWNLLSDNEKKYALHFAEEFKYDLIELVKGLKNKINDKGKPVIKESRYDTLRRKFEPYWAMYNHNKKNVDLCKYFFEKDILGYSYSIQLINIYQKYCGDLSTIKEVKEKFDDNQWVHFAAEVTDVVEGTAKNEKKTKYLKCMVKDNTASLAAMLFNENISNHYEENPKGVREGDIVMIKGKKYKDSISCTRISVQDTQIFLKIKQMKDKIKKEESQIVSETISKPILLDKNEPLLELNN
jgi:G:T-mismatch repair DNA endonuclease (very short patch repair protein)